MTAAANWVLDAWERGADRAPLDRTVTLLAAVTGLDVDTAAAVDVGSRDGALIGALAAWHPAPLRTVLRCGGCGEVLEVPIDPRELPVTPWREPGGWFTVDVGRGTVTYRLPTSADLGGHAGSDARAALLARCAPGVDPADPVAGAVEDAMEEAAASAALTVRARCGCGVATDAAVDPGVLLWAEIRTAATTLLHEVHALASAYGWTEPEILALTPTRRASYLALIGTDG